jgi:hypothetical protein
MEKLVQILIKKIDFLSKLYKFNEKYNLFELLHLFNNSGLSSYMDMN